MSYNQRTGAGGEFNLRTGLSAFQVLDAGNLTTGTVAEARLPTISKSKINRSNAWDPSEIPDLNAAKVSAGVLSADRIPDLDARKVTTGEFSADRIPNLDAAKVATGTLAQTRIPALTLTDTEGTTNSLDGTQPLPKHTMLTERMVNTGSEIRLLFGAQDVLKVSDMAHSYNISSTNTASNTYDYAVLVPIPQGWYATQVFVSQTYEVSSSPFRHDFFNEVGQDMRVDEVPLFEGTMSHNYDGSTGYYQPWNTGRGPSSLPSTTFIPNSVVTLDQSGVSTTSNLRAAGSTGRHQLQILIGRLTNSGGDTIYYHGGYVVLV